jgi:hypothetical protein
VVKEWNVEKGSRGTSKDTSTIEEEKYVQTLKKGSCGMSKDTSTIEEEKDVQTLKRGSRGTSKDTCTIEEEKYVQTVESSIDNIKQQVSHTNRPKRKYDESYLQYGFT